ncbi:DUF3853 family protein [Cruoricaptor ignavus]|uniref:DUF3853 family protein n=1 Tax=Cruoricaptor ignavus TaxID=1118202 RepID=A0A7M1T6D3_9FLAO|nr:DUF3853 family protein [Cruoricaptor ignavus]QOR74634.1 DUF3853 family protein [Cruoricaptor ignavus]
MNAQRPLWELTVGEFRELLQEFSQTEPGVKEKEKEYVYGISGLAKLLGCSNGTASKLKASGIFGDAIIQQGRTIIIDADAAISAMRENSGR